MSGRIVRRVLFRTHFIAGLVAGLVLAVVGLTGAALSYEEEIVDALNPQLTVVPDGQPRTPDALIAAVRAQFPERAVGGFNWRGPRHAAEVRFDGGPDAGSVAIDPYSGTIFSEVRGDGTLHFLEQLHRTLAAGPIGKQVVGASTLVLLLMAITGLWLRWPRRWFSPRAWLRIDGRTRGRAFLWQLHSVIATWVLPLYLVSALTGLFWSYESYRNALFQMAGVEAPAGRGGQRGPGGPGGAPPPPAIAVPLDPSWQALTALEPGLARAMVGYPRAAGAPLEWRYLDANAPHPRAMSMLRVAVGDGQVIAHERFAELPEGRRAMALIFPLHSGSIAGMPGRVAMLLASVLMPFFFITGIMMWIARRKATRRNAGISGVIIPANA